MKNKEKYDLRELYTVIVQDWNTHLAILTIHYYGTLIHKITLPYEKCHFIVNHYNEWLEDEAKEDENS